MFNLTKRIKEIIRGQGFHKVGISPATQPKGARRLEQWLRNEYHGEMSWMKDSKYKRMEIEEFFPGAKSVICVAHNYYSADRTRSDDQSIKISRYARGDDYHKTMKKKLKTVLASIKSIDPEMNGRLAVDTAPIMEKQWAQQAGLGWQGKNSNLITKEFGSWIFLGEIIIDKELIYDQPIDDFCGSCQACLEACPTKAIVRSYVVDARKCISYLTIEYHHKSLDKKYKEAMNGWIFGCDICQEVCPWNRFQKQTDEAAYFPREENINLNIDELSQLDEKAFKKRFKKSPVLRAGCKDFQRNLRAALASRIVK